MKRLTFIIFLISLSFTVFGFDFGGNLEDSTYYHYDNSSDLYHADTLSLWMKSAVLDDVTLFIQGSYTYTTDQPYSFNLDYFKVENKKNAFFNYTLGRFYVSDFSSYVFSHKLDGASFSVNYPGFILSANAGYTGLLFNSSSSIEMTLADQSDGDGVFDLEAPRLIGGVQLMFPDLFMHQDLKTGIWIQIDNRNDSDMTAEGTTTLTGTGGKLDSQYFGVSVSGPVLFSLYYDSFVYLGTGRTLSYINSVYDYKPVVSFLGSVGLRYYIEAFLYSKISFRFLYSSGDDDYTSFTEGNTDGNGTVFIPVSRQSLAQVFSPQLGNIFFSRLSYSLKPLSGLGSQVLENIQMEISGINFFRSTTGPISESGIDPSSTSLYLGTEIDGTINFRPYSDLGVSLSGGVFMPNNGTDGAFFESQRDMEFLARLGLSFSF